MKIATKTGDKGISGLLSGERLPKSHEIFEAVGTLDELSVSLGAIKVLLSKDSFYYKVLEDIQLEIIQIMGELAYSKDNYCEKFDYLNDQALDELDKDVSYLEQLPELQQTDWVLYGGCELAVRFDTASKICRRAERAVVKLNPRNLILSYCNRLSDFLYLAARDSNVNHL